MFSELVNLVKSQLISLAKNEPALLVGALASGLVLLAAKANIVLDDASVQAVLTPFVTAILARFVVKPLSR